LAILVTYRPDWRKSHCFDAGLAEYVALSLHFFFGILAGLTCISPGRWTATGRL
jgi:hypothetical protein